MLHFIYGEDNFSSSEALKKIESDFVKEYGDLNFDKLEGSELKKGIIESKIEASPFLADKRLLIVQNLLRDGDKEIKKAFEAKIKSIPSFSDVVIYENGLPDKRESIFKALDKIEGKQVFNPLNDYQLKSWIKARIEKENIQISDQASSKLLLYVGADLFRLENEIHKLIDFVNSKSKKEISVEDVTSLVEPNNSYKIFDLTDAIAARNPKKAIQVLEAFRNSGEDGFMIFNLIIHQVRIMLIVDDLSLHNPDNIAKETSVHPFVVKKTLQNLKNFTKKKIFGMYAKLHDLDWKIKTGELDINTALEIVIVDFSK